MQLFRNLDEARLAEPTVLTIGTFDGLHRGHQDLLRRLKAMAKEFNAKSAVLAFHPRPKTVLAPHLTGDDYLTTAQERIELFREFGIEVLLLVPFTLELAQITAEDFIQQLVDTLSVVGLCVGHDFALGKGRAGNVDKLRELGQKLGYRVREVDAFLLDGEIISSTRIRQLFEVGDVRQAAHYLGRYPSLQSSITQGARRGRTIGFPTANFVVPPERLLPANGVYATFISRPGQSQRLPSVTNIGVRPSFGEATRTVETYIFDFVEEIYGQTFILEFVERLRPEMKFDGIEALKAQIQRDSAQAQALLADELPSRILPL